jgi:hypothetical protein
MAKYTIIPDGLNAFGVEVVSPDRFLPKRGFATAIEAAAWIAQQQGRRGGGCRSRRVARSRGRYGLNEAPKHAEE